MTPTEKAREAVRRSRARRRKQIEAMRGTPAYRAIPRATEALRVMVYGKGGRSHDCTHALASALFDALGSVGVNKLMDELRDEIAIGGSTADRSRRIAAGPGASVEQLAAAINRELAR